jgi:hypothetical protein
VTAAACRFGTAQECGVFRAESIYGWKRQLSKTGVAVEKLFSGNFNNDIRL